MGVLQMRIRVLVLLCALIVVAASCGAASDKISERIAEEAIEASGGGELDVDISGDGDDMTINVETEEGSFSTGSNVELPGELNVPVPDGGNVTASGTQGSSAYASITYPRDRYDEIASFYDDWTSGTGDEWETYTSTFDMDGETQRSAQWSTTGGSYVAVTDCFDVYGDGDSLDSVCVTLNQGG